MNFDDIAAAFEQMQSDALEQEFYIVSTWLAEQGADAARHTLLKYLDDDGGITYVLADSETVAPFIRDGVYPLDSARARFPYLYVKPDFNAQQNERLPA